MAGYLFNSGKGGAMAVEGQGKGVAAAIAAAGDHEYLLYVHFFCDSVLFGTFMGCV